MLSPPAEYRTPRWRWHHSGRLRRSEPRDKYGTFEHGTTVRVHCAIGNSASRWRWVAFCGLNKFHNAVNRQNLTCAVKAIKTRNEGRRQTWRSACHVQTVCHHKFVYVADLLRLHKPCKQSRNLQLVCPILIGTFSEPTKVIS